jgi:hypothetical protein
MVATCGDGNRAPQTSGRWTPQDRKRCTFCRTIPAISSTCSVPVDALVLVYQAWWDSSSFWGTRPDRLQWLSVRWWGPRSCFGSAGRRGPDKGFRNSSGSVSPHRHDLPLQGSGPPRARVVSRSLDAALARVDETSFSGRPGLVRCNKRSPRRVWLIDSSCRLWLLLLLIPSGGSPQLYASRESSGPTCSPAAETMTPLPVVHCLLPGPYPRFSSRVRLAEPCPGNLVSDFVNSW